jgi:hypothetical protein
MATDFNCYIDEAGDEGIETGGSRWFILGALIVQQDLDSQTSTMVSRVKQRFGHDDKFVLQWKKIKKHGQKLYICQEYQTEQWTFSCVATDKTHPFITKGRGINIKYQLYNYSARLLLERLSWYARDHGNGKALPIFEYRSNTSYDKMREYFEQLHEWIPEEEIQIAWDNLEHLNFKILPKKQRRLLQASDNLCGMVKEGLEYDGYGNIEPRYVLSVGNRFYRRGSNLFSYGLKFLHANQSVLSDLKNEYEWLKRI